MHWTDTSCIAAQLQSSTVARVKYLMYQISATANNHPNYIRTPYYKFKLKRWKALLVLWFKCHHTVQEMFLTWLCGNDGCNLYFETQHDLHCKISTRNKLQNYIV